MDSDDRATLSELKQLVRKFCEDRDWDKYHNAKELAIGIVTEGAELLQHFRFKNEKEVDEMLSDDKKAEEIHEEIADVFYFLLRLSQRYKIDLATVLKEKLKKNNIRYPVEKFRGSNKKYSEAVR